MAAEDWTPALEDVGALIFARTKVAGGKGGTGTFNDNTRPTGTQVLGLIGQAQRLVKSTIVAEPCSEDLQADARAAVALYAAMLVEQSYYPEQTAAAGSSFQSLRSLWKDQIAALKASVAANCGGGAPGEEIAGQAVAGGAGSFDDGIPLIGRDFPCDW